MSPEPTRHATQRLDHAIAALAGVSRRQAQRLIVEGDVLVNGRVTSSRDKGCAVSPFDEIEVQCSADELVPNMGLPLTVLAAGEGWVVCDKPAGMAVHPLHGREKDTLLNAAAARYPQLLDPAWVGDEGPLRKGVVHRLDLDTTGCVALALDRAAWLRLREAFSRHKVRKVYHAVVHVTPDSDPRHLLPGGEWRRLSLPLAVTRHRPALVSVVAPDHQDVRLCALSYRVLETFPHAGIAQVEVELETGFLHQVRVMLAHAGLPVMGDGVYGPVEADIAQDGTGPIRAARHLLHAASLSFEGVGATSDLPADMMVVLQRLRAGNGAWRGRPG